MGRHSSPSGKFHCFGATLKRRYRLRYAASQEHKRHPGPWGPARWHMRQPALPPCPPDIAVETAQAWLERAFELEGELLAEEGRPPRYLYWYDAGREELFEARRTREPDTGDPWPYKGYPIPPTLKVIGLLVRAGVIGEREALVLRRRLRRRRRRR